GIGDERNRSAVGETREQSRPRLDGIVLVIGGERRRDPVMVQELAGYAAVLAGDQVGGGEDLERPHRDVAQIADRGRDQVESRGKGWCNGRPAVDEVLPRPLTAGAAR